MCAELGDGLLTGVLDGAQRLARGLRVAVEQVLGGAGLDHHDADAVRDDVVQLAGDPGALRGDGVPDPRLLVLGQPARPSSDSAAWLRVAAPQSAADRGHDDQRHDREGDVRRRPDAGHAQEEHDERRARDQQPGRRALAVGVAGDRVDGDQQRHEVRPTA